VGEDRHRQSVVMEFSGEENFLFGNERRFKKVACFLTTSISQVTLIQKSLFKLHLP